MGRPERISVPSSCRMKTRWRHHWQWPLENLLQGRVCPSCREGEPTPDRGMGVEWSSGSVLPISRHTAQEWEGQRARPFRQLSSRLKFVMCLVLDRGGCSEDLIAGVAILTDRVCIHRLQIATTICMTRCTWESWTHTQVRQLLACWTRTGSHLQDHQIPNSLAPLLSEHTTTCLGWTTSF